MKLYWSPHSPYVRKVMVCAHESGLADRIEPVLAVVAMTRPHPELMREHLDSLHNGPRLFPAPPERRWEALRWHALGDGMLDLLILWRNELLRPPAQRSADILAAFELKIRTSVAALDREADAIASAPFRIGHIAIGCALGYIDFRFPELGWRDGNAPIAHWFETFARRPAARLTLPADQP